MRSQFSPKPRSAKDFCGNLDPKLLELRANQVFQWRRLYGQGRLGNPPASVARLLPVSVAETTRETILGGANGTVAPGTIHLELRKARVRIEGNIDPAVLHLVLQSVLG